MNHFFFKRYKSLTALFTIVFVAVLFASLGILHPITACAIVALYQLAQFAMCKRLPVCFIGGLTPAQIKEFEGICDELKEHADLLPQLRELLTDFPNLGSFLKTLKDVPGNISKLQKGALRGGVGHSGVRWIGNVPFVTDDCAEHLTATFVVECARMGDNALKHLNPNARTHEGIVGRACGFLGVEQRTAMSATQIPLPTNFMSQIVELVFAYGQARQYATVYPLGGGTTKLPRLAAGEDLFGFIGTAGVSGGMGQAVPEKRVTAELITFDPSKCGGLVRLPTELEEDNFIQLGQFLARYIARRFAHLEDDSMFNGDGTATYGEILGVGPYCAANVAYLRKLDAGKVKVSDITLDDIRQLRGLVSAAVLANMAANGETSAAYYAHPSLEPLFASFNKYPNHIVWDAKEKKLDGWPVRWIGVGAVNNNIAQPLSYALHFGDLSYWYLGERGTVRIEVSKEVFFATDEVALRALERIDINGMATDAMSALQLGAAAA